MALSQLSLARQALTEEDRRREQPTHLGEVSEDPLLLGHCLGEEVEREALDLRDAGSAPRADDAGGRRKGERTHIEEHVLVLDEELGEEAQVLAVELRRRVKAVVRKGSREMPVEAEPHVNERTLATAPSTSQMLIAPRW